MTAKMTAAEGLSLATSLATTMAGGDLKTVGRALAAMDQPDLRIVTISALRVMGAMLLAEGRETGADPEAPAASAFRLASRAVQEAARE